MDSHARIAVVGGGIFGTATALALARRGHAHVDLIERDHLGSGSTALAGGLLSLHTWNDSDAQLIHETRAQLEALVAWGHEQDLGAARTAWNPVGGLTMAPQAHGELLETFRRRLEAFRIECGILEPAAARRRFPNFRVEPGEVALWSREGGVIESTDVLDLARAQGKALGLRVREGRPVSQIQASGGRVSGLVFEDGETTPYDAVAVCGGTWTNRLLATCGARVPMIPYRTQIATIVLPGVGRDPILHDLSLGFYSRSESEGRLLAGDGTQLRAFEPDAFDRGPDPDFVESIAERVVRRYARGTEARYHKGWAGLCGGTPDRRPLLGRVPDVDGLWVLAGDNGFGLMRGLALGTRLADAMDGRETQPADPTLRLDRFGPHPPESFPLSEGFSYPPLSGDGKPVSAKPYRRR